LTYVESCVSDDWQPNLTEDDATSVLRGNHAAAFSRRSARRDNRQSLNCGLPRRLLRSLDSSSADFSSSSEHEDHNEGSELAEFLLRRRERELTTLRGLLENAQEDRAAAEQDALLAAATLRDERSRVLTLESDLEASREREGQMEDDCLTFQVQLESLSKEKLLLKEHVEAARAACARFEEGATSLQATLEAERASAAKAQEEAAASTRIMQDSLCALRQQLLWAQVERNEVTAAHRECQECIAKLRSEGACTEEQAIRRVAELLARNVAEDCASAEKRRAAQRRLLVCLHPDKCPATQAATQLTQEMQNSRWWIH